MDIIIRGCIDMRKFVVYLAWSVCLFSKGDGVMSVDGKYRYISQLRALFKEYMKIWYNIQVIIHQFKILYFLFI